jgi:hypothetical protein
VGIEMRQEIDDYFSQFNKWFFAIIQSMGRLRYRAIKGYIEI